MYTIGDKVEHYKNGAIYTSTDRISTGTVTYGPVEVDGIDHYRVKWDDKTEETIECLIPSNKYGYKLI
jgi:hypothetical protein